VTNVRNRELSTEEQSDRTQGKAKRASSNTSSSVKNLGVRPAIVYYEMLQKIHETSCPDYSMNIDRWGPSVAN